MTTLVSIPNLMRANRVVVRPILSWEVWIDNTNHVYDLAGNWILFAICGSYKIAELVLENELNRRFGSDWFYSESKREYVLYKSHKTVGRIKGAR